MEIHNEFDTSVAKALSELDPDWRDLDGLIVCGQHNMDGTDPEELIERIALARQEEQPYLGICFGHQLAAIEYARNALGMYDATSEEWGEGKNFIVKKLPKLKVGLHEGESYWNNYEVDEFIEAQWKKPEHFVTAQFHPEYQSSAERPHPLLIKFLQLCGSTKSLHHLEDLREKRKMFGLLKNTNQ